MAVLDGEIVLSNTGLILNPHISVDLQGYDFADWPPPPDGIATNLGAAGRVTAFPVSAAGRALSGHVIRAFSDDWYHRVHMRPRVLALGNLVSTQGKTVEVWNAWLFPIELLGIDGVTAGIELAGPTDFPFEFGALQLITWDVIVTPDGPSHIDVTLTWDFTAVPDAQLSVTGDRVVAWTLVPDWTDGIKEQLAWWTEIASSDRRDEQRRARRLSPRRSFDIQMLAEDRERSLFDTMMRGWGSRVWAVPIFPDIQRLSAPITSGVTSIACSTAGRDFRVGGLAMLRGESAFLSELVQVDEIASGNLTLVRPTQMAWPAGTRLYPARTARFPEQPQWRRLTDQAISIEATFVLNEASDWPELAGLPTYRDSPVFDARPDETEDLTGTFERLLYELDNGSGLPTVLDGGDAAFGTQAHRWVLDGVAERANYRSLLHLLRGRLVAVWIPTHADDLHLLETISGTSVMVENIGYTRFGLGRLGREDIRIELRNGTVFYRRITTAVIVDADREQLSIDTVLGTSVAPADVRRISFMMLARGNSDTTEIQHVTDVEGVATSRITFVGVAEG